MSVTRSVTQPLSWLDRNESDRRAAGLRRSLRPRSAADAVVDLASNDYLGLSGHPDVIEGGVAALRTWGAGSTGSRLVTGDTDLHEQFEDELAEFVGAPSALVFSSGYAANIGAVVALSGPGSLIVSDAFSHASLVDACRLSRARVAVTPHNDVDAIEAALAARTEDRALVVTESVYAIPGLGRLTVDAVLARDFPTIQGVTRVAPSALPHNALPPPVRARLEQLLAADDWPNLVRLAASGALLPLGLAPADLATPQALGRAPGLRRPGRRCHPARAGGGLPAQQSRAQLRPGADRHHLRRAAGHQPVRPAAGAARRPGGRREPRLPRRRPCLCRGRC